MKKQFNSVLITGGAGYVGSVLVPKLLKEGYEVKVLDLFMYGDDVFKDSEPNPRIKKIKGDLRDVDLLDRELRGVDAVIHLACISNDPSFELNPNLGKSINYDAFIPLTKLSKKHGVKRFIYASSSSVYGIKEVENVHEDLPLEPLTDYSKYKALCEDVLKNEDTGPMKWMTVRPATVCGYSPRLRLDLSVNILTNLAVNKGEISVFGGQQKRPNIHIEDMTDFYVQSLLWPDEKIHRKIYNAGYENHTVENIAFMVKSVIGEQVKIKYVPTDDNRSYHISAEKLARELGFKPKHTITDAVRDLKHAFDAGKIPDSLTASRYFNIKKMQEIHLQ